MFNEVMFLTVQVKGPTHEFKKKSTVMIKNKESLIFVQTDKSIYKPGQTGMVRSTVRTASKRKLLSLCLTPTVPVILGSLIVVLPTYKDWSVTHQNFFISVKFRVVSLDENFHPLNELVSLLSFA